MLTTTRTPKSIPLPSFVEYVEHSIYCPECRHTYRRGLGGPQTAQWWMDMHRARLGHHPRVESARPVMRRPGAPK